MLRKPIVTIDGPAGAGKSTVSRLVANRLDYTLLDSGALYRCVALVALRGGGLEDSDALGRIASDLAARDAIQFVREPSGQRVLLDGEDVSAAIRTPQVGGGASRASALPPVRAALLDLQRAAGARGGLVAEGRDMGTVVYPRAELKFFLTASAEARALRRHQELAAKTTHPPTLAEVSAEVRERDDRDMGRSVAPLARAEDAQLIETTTMTIDEVVSLIVQAARAFEQPLRAPGA